MKSTIKQMIVVSTALMTLMGSVLADELKGLEMPREVLGGEKARATVFLDEEAERPVYVQLQSSNGLFVPGTVVVQPGEKEVTFDIFARDTSKETEVRVSARSQGENAFGEVTVLANQEPVAERKKRKRHNRYVPYYGDTVVYYGHPYYYRYNSGWDNSYWNDWNWNGDYVQPDWPYDPNQPHILGD
jgi:hypothetical protein